MSLKAGQIIYQKFQLILAQKVCNCATTEHLSDQLDAIQAILAAKNLIKAVAILNIYGVITQITMQIWLQEF